MPALQALKGGVVTETVIAALSLDVSRLPDLRKTEKADSTPAEERAVQGTSVGAEEIQGNGQPESSTPRLQNRNNLSPRTFEECVGQERAKQSLRITLAAAKKTGTLPAHILICSPYGYGKTDARFYHCERSEAAVFFCKCRKPEGRPLDFIVFFET